MLVAEESSLLSFVLLFAILFLAIPEELLVFPTK